MPTLRHYFSLGQFIIGLFTISLNILLFSSVLLKTRLRTAFYVFLANICLSNCILGIIICVDSISDNDELPLFNESQGNAVIMTSFVTVSTWLALLTSRLVAIRNPNKTLSLRVAINIVGVIWIIVFVLALLKRSLSVFQDSGACFNCFLIFEVTILVLLVSGSWVQYFISLCSLRSRRNRTVSDTAVGPVLNYHKEYRLMVTIGILLSSFSVPFFTYVSLMAAWLDSSKLVTVLAVEIVGTVFYAHCVIDPVLLISKDEDVRGAVTAVLRGRWSGNEASASGQEPGDHNRIEDQPTNLPTIESMNRPNYGSTEKANNAGKSNSDLAVTACSGKVKKEYNPFDENSDAEMNYAEVETEIKVKSN